MAVVRHDRVGASLRHGTPPCCRCRAGLRDDLSAHELAQLNIARLFAPLDSPPPADFVANLDTIDSLAESSGGFIWRLMTSEGDATALEYPFGGETIVNLSVWRGAVALHAFTYRSAQIEIMRRRRERFAHLDAHTVLRWVPAGHRPTPWEGKRRLEALRADGPTPRAFTFRRALSREDGKGRDEVIFDERCPAC